MGEAFRGSRRGGPASGTWNWPKTSLLGLLAEPSRNRLLQLGTAVQYPGPGKVLIREGDDTTFVVILLAGVVKATGMTQNGRSALLAIRMGGDLVGEFVAADGKPRSATVTTGGVVAAKVVKQAEFIDCVQRDPQIAHALNRSIVSKLRVANARRVDFSGCDVPTRLARVLHELAVTYGDRSENQVVIGWPLTQPELATLAGVAEPSAHKVLRRLREQGVVSTGYRSITVLDLARLDRIAYP